MTRRHRTWILTLAGAAGLIVAAAAASRAEPPASAPQFTADGKMIFPADYRTWVYLSTGMDMSYSPETQAIDPSKPVNHFFDSVFVNREAYEAFQKTGTWPDKTVMVLEVRRGQSRGSINQKGVFQTARAGAEVHVKDVNRFKDTGGWAFFGLQGSKPMEMTPPNQGCIACHEAHGAVDTTFVQFYPTLIPVAQEKKTFSAKYLAEEAKAETK